MSPSPGRDPGGGSPTGRSPSDGRAADGRTAADAVTGTGAVFRSPSAVAPTTGPHTGLAAPVTGPRSDAVRLCELRLLEEFRAAEELFADIWRPPPGSPGPVGMEMIRALSHAGNYVAGAYLGARLVGASVGFLSAPPGRALHSHITGVRAGRGIGHALKLHQRDWARDQGLDRITWTFDPLVRRNAYFNLSKLGATLVEYHTSFYGTMHDAINTGDDSDRVVALWRIGPGSPGPAGPDAGSGRLGEAPEPLLVADGSGRPRTLATDASTVLVELPSDIEALRRTDPAAATAWRLAVREVLGGLLAGGARVSGFHARSGYLVDRTPGRTPGRTPARAPGRTPEASVAHPGHPPLPETNSKESGNR
ncbi:GNAT family N-acetyltransferase [Streptomyces uncialis]|uniref:GNAT family N-acetyltransferase n=1 Tax=Streptomyces uncialis TaxID=1048205 RepID=UPI0033C3A0EA